MFPGFVGPVREAPNGLECGPRRAILLIREPCNHHSSLHGSSRQAKGRDVLMSRAPSNIPIGQDGLSPHNVSRNTEPPKGEHAVTELQNELDRLLGELAELDRCSAMGEGGNHVLMTIARRGTRQAIAEVRRLMAQNTAVA